MLAFKLYDRTKIPPIMKKRTKSATRHLLPSLVKKNTLLCCVERLDEEKKVRASRGLAQTTPPTKVIVPLGPPLTAIILPLAVILSPRLNEDEDAVMS